LTETRPRLTKRFTFSNPQPALYDRIAAVRQIVRQVPVAGKVVFLDGATFTKGVPGMVANLDELQSEFGDWDKEAAKVKINSKIHSAKEMLKAEIVDATIDLALEKLPGLITEEDNQKLIQRYIASADSK